MVETQQASGGPSYYFPNYFAAIPSFRYLAIICSNSSNDNCRDNIINSRIIPAI